MKIKPILLISSKGGQLANTESKKYQITFEKFLEMSSYTFSNLCEKVHTGVNPCTHFKEIN